MKVASRGHLSSWFRDYSLDHVELWQFLTAGKQMVSGSVMELHSRKTLNKCYGAILNYTKHHFMFTIRSLLDKTIF